MRGEGNKFKSIWNSMNCNEMKQSRFKGILTGHFFAELAASPSATDLAMVFFVHPLLKGHGRETVEACGSFSRDLAASGLRSFFMFLCPIDMMYWNHHRLGNKNSVGAACPVKYCCCQSYGS